MLRRTKIILGVIVIAVIGIGIAAYRNRQSSEEQIQTATVTRGTIRQEIEFTGNIAAKQSAELGFPGAGVIKNILVDVGDTVTAGQLLVTLDPSLEEFDVAKAAADRASATDAAYLDWQAAETALTATKSENSQLLEKQRQVVRDAKAELDQNKAVWEQTVRESGSESSAAKTKYLLVTSARSTYTNAQKTLEQTIKTVAKDNAAATATRDKALADYEATQQASLTQKGLSALAASEASAREQLERSRLVAPFNGVITSKNVEKGEVVAAASGIVTIETLDTLQVVSDVPETDSVKLAVGQQTTVTIDALSLEPFPALVTTIDPSAKVIEGVPTYRVTLRIPDHATSLRPGLSATVVVHVTQKENVLLIPRRAVIEQDRLERVKIKEPDGSTQEQTVKTGIIGSDGTIEITEGLHEGDVIIVREPKPN